MGRCRYEQVAANTGVGSLSLQSGNPEIAGIAEHQKIRKAWFPMMTAGGGDAAKAGPTLIRQGFVKRRKSVLRTGGGRLPEQRYLSEAQVAEFLAVLLIKACKKPLREGRRGLLRVQVSPTRKVLVVLLPVLKGRRGFNVLRPLGIDLVRQFPGKGYRFVGNAEIEVVEEL